MRIILKPLPPATLWFMEKWFSTKLLPGAKKVGDHLTREHDYEPQTSTQRQRRQRSTQSRTRPEALMGGQLQETCLLLLLLPDLQSPLQEENHLPFQNLL